ncbi:MAG: AlpA family phage regulatory protein [Candidatus Saccharibacteria bacterium]|nr:AlpA family phage regulatory protein [Rhodoferax sp.]
MASLQNTLIQFKPRFYDRVDAAPYCGLSVSTMERMVRQKEFPQPRVLAKKRVGWLLTELDAWCDARPVSNQPPPPNTGHANRSNRGIKTPAQPALQA